MGSIELQRRRTEVSSPPFPRTVSPRSRAGRALVAAAASGLVGVAAAGVPAAVRPGGNILTTVFRIGPVLEDRPVLLNDLGQVAGHYPSGNSPREVRYGYGLPFLWSLSGDRRQQTPSYRVLNSYPSGVVALPNTVRPQVVIQYALNRQRPLVWDGRWSARLLTPGTWDHGRGVQVNDSGLVVQRVWEDGQSPGKVIGWDPKTDQQREYAPPTEGAAPEPSGINQRGEVVGNDFQSLRGVFWTADGSPTWIGPVPASGEQIAPASLSDQTPAQAAGRHYLPGTAQAAFVWSASAGLADLTLPGHTSSRFVAQNRQGQVLFNVPRACLWSDEDGDRTPDPEEIRDLTPAGAPHSVAMALNSAQPATAVIAVQSAADRQPRFHGITGGIRVELGPLFPRGYRDGKILAINREGQLLGTAKSGRDTEAFLFIRRQRGG